MSNVDMVNEPPHYKDASGVECIEVTKHMSFCGGNCFKYLYRAGKKGSTVEDLKRRLGMPIKHGSKRRLSVSRQWSLST